MIHLASVSINKPRPAEAKRYPFSVPVVRSLARLEFPTEVTFLVGENGSGKSTLLEAIALAAGLPTVGSESADRDKSLAGVRPLARQLKLSWNRRTHRGFFMRTEDFFGFTRQLASTREEYLAELERIDAETEGRSDLARELARAPYMRELKDMESRYGENLDANSHGESYFRVFQSRFVPGGLYMLDEPEAPLSPLRQLSLISMLREMVEQREAQFIVATHAPILMAYPGATIYSFENGSVRRAAYDELEHVTVTRDFLNNPERYLKHL